MSLFLLTFFFLFVELICGEMFCGGRVSLCCSVTVPVLLGLWVPKPMEDGKNGEAARGWRRRASMLSLSRCISKPVKARAQSIHHDSYSVGKLQYRSLRFQLCLTVCFWGKLLYLDVRPLGLQVLHARQNLLLVPGKSHTHLSQFTTRKKEKQYFIQHKSTIVIFSQIPSLCRCPR